MTARSAAALVADVVTGLVATQRFITRDEPWAQLIIDMAVNAALGDGTSDRYVPMPPAGMPEPNQRQVIFSAQDAATRRIWQQHRIVHDIDPDLWQELGEVDEDTRLSAAVLAHLPYPDPFIAWPALPRTPMADGKFMRPVGCFVTGRSSVRLGAPDILAGPNVSLGWPISVSSPHAAGGLVLTIVHRVEEADGRAVHIGFMGGIADVMFSRVTLDLRPGSEVSVREMADEIAERYDDGIASGVSPTDTGFNDAVRPTLRRIVAVLLYLCATNADLRPLPAPASRRAAKGTGRAAKAPKVIEVGYTLGAGLRAWRRRRGDESHAPSAAGTRVRPHVRRSHFHTFWTGEGRAVARVKWLLPITVNAEQPTTRTAVQPIRRAKEATR